MPTIPLLSGAYEMRQMVLAFTLAVVMPPCSDAASFDCGKAKSVAEKMVCTDSELSRLDDDLSYQYRSAPSPSRTALKGEQTAWLTRRDSCSADRVCLKATYIERLRVLEARKERATKGVKPESLIEGSYESRAFDICFVGSEDENGNRPFVDCSPHRNKLSIVDLGGRGLRVELEFLGTGADECQFTGVGVLKGLTLVAVDPEDKDCPLEITYQSGRLSLHQDDQCSRQYCGTRASIDGQILYKRP